MIKPSLVIALTLLLASGCTGQPVTDGKTGMQNAPGGTPSRMLSQSDAQAGGTPQLKDGQERTLRTNTPLSLADLHQIYRSTFLFNGPSDRRQAALTFDDVPDADFTPKILDVLAKYGVKATFFVVGNRAEAHPDIVKRIVDEGHAIGSHSYSHPNLIKMSDDTFHYEIEQTETVLQGITGFKPALFRPPYGNVNDMQIEWLASKHYHIINWNVDSLDWKGLNGEQVAANVLGHIVPGAIILQHGAGGTGENLSGTIAALPTIIDQMKAKGIALVTIPELLGIPLKQ